MEGNRRPGLDGTTAACQCPNGDIARAARSLHIHRTKSGRNNWFRRRSGRSPGSDVNHEAIIKNNRGTISPFPEILRRSVSAATGRYRYLHPQIAFDERETTCAGRIFVAASVVEQCGCGILLLSWENNPGLTWQP